MVSSDMWTRWLGCYIEVEYMEIVLFDVSYRTIRGDTGVLKKRGASAFSNFFLRLILCFA